MVILFFSSNEQNILYNVWKATVDMHESVILKRISTQHLRQEIKLDTIVNEQVRSMLSSQPFSHMKILDTAFSITLFVCLVVKS